MEQEEEQEEEDEKEKKREVGNEVEKRVSGEKKKGREEKRGGVEAYEYPVRMRRENEREKEETL